MYRHSEKMIKGCFKKASVVKILSDLQEAVLNWRAEASF
jgi:hypothetical protein